MRRARALAAGCAVALLAVAAAPAAALLPPAASPPRDPAAPFLHLATDHDAITPTTAGPTIAFTRAIGGSGSDAGRAVAVDRDGNAYVTGETSSPDFPGARANLPARGTTAAFVTKLDASGRVVYTTILGGERYSAGRGIAVDAAGRAYITGATDATDFPTTRGALQRSYGGGPFDAFVAVLEPSGRHLVYSTFLGDTHYDEGNAIAIDRAGRAVIAGRTVSPQFPRAGRLRPAVGGGAFVAKLDRGGSRLVFSTVFGGDDRGNHGNTAFGVAVDRRGATYATGVTNATTFPTTHPLQPALAGGGDAFVVKIDPAGRRVVYSTYLGGGADDGARAIAADAAGDAYVAGVTSSSDFPLRGSPAPAAGAAADADAFVAKLDPSGRALSYATRIGGRGDDEGSAIAVDPRGGAFVTGHTSSTDFAPATPDGGAFVARLPRDGSALAFATRLAGTPADAGLGIAVDRFGAVAVTGVRGTDAFVSVLAPSPVVALRRQLIGRGRDARIGRLLRLGHAALRVAAPTAGTVRIGWYAGRTRVAGGRARLANSGTTQTITMRLSRDGRRRLARARKIGLTARGVFSPAGAAPVRAQTTFTLVR